MLNALESAFSSRPEFVDTINSITTRVRDRGGVLLYTSPSMLVGLGEIAPSVAAHFRIFSYRRTTLVYGIRPSTPALAMLTTNLRGEIPRVWLLPIR